MKHKYIFLSLMSLLLVACINTGSSSYDSTSEEPSSSISEGDSTSGSNPGSTLPAGTPAPIRNVKSINEFQIDSFYKGGLPSLGNQEVLVVPVEIKGNNFPSNYKNVIEKTFNGTSEETGWESVSSYYTKSSFGKLNLTFNVLDKITTSNNKAYYEAEMAGDYNIGDEAAIVDVFNKMDAIDVSKYDTNGDNNLDSVIFIYSVDYSNEDPWWAWVYTTDGFSRNNAPRLGGKILNYYMWASYSFIFDDTLAVSATYNAETYIHELGHLLAFPDLYTTEGSFAYGALGNFDMMDANQGDHGPLNKVLWGWTEPLLLNKGFSYDITLQSYSLSTSGEEIVLLIPRTNEKTSYSDLFKEYLLIMYYTPDGLYKGHNGNANTLLGPGIITYHVDARIASNAHFWDFFLQSNIEGTSNFLVEILEADFNNSIPSRRTGITMADVLSDGAIDLNTYNWNQGGKIDVGLNVKSLSSTSASISVDAR